MNYELYTSGLSVDEINTFLVTNDSQFRPSLSSRVNLKEYSEKLFNNSRIIHIRNNKDIIGLVAFYMNDNSQHFAFISLICVLEEYLSKGVGSFLMKECTLLLKKESFRSIRLEVDESNLKAIAFYQKAGFIIDDHKQSTFLMSKQLV